MDASLLTPHLNGSPEAICVSSVLSVDSVPWSGEALDAAYSRSCHVLRLLIEAGSTPGQLAKTSSWACLQHLHHLNPEAYLSAKQWYRIHQQSVDGALGASEQRIAFIFRSSCSLVTEQRFSVSSDASDSSITQVQHSAAA